MDTGDQDARAQILEELQALRRREERLGKAKRALIREARLHNSSWTQISEALGVTKEQVHGLYKADIRRIQEAGADDDEVTNEEALEQLRREDEALRQAGSASPPGG